MNRTVKIHPRQTIATPNPRMWGIFYEEINHAGDGGLYAELLRNRSFADSRLPADTVWSGGKARTRAGFVCDFPRTELLPGWTMEKSSGAAAAMELTRDRPRNPACPEQLMLQVLRPGSGVRVCNSGYWGIPVKPQDYYGYLIARGEGVTRVRVGLMHRSGAVLCSQTLPVTAEFQKQTFRMTCPCSEDDVRFFVEVTQQGCLYLDFATLFPADTDGGRPYGLRKDLMEMLRALRPGFLRFPGGCVVEGFNLADAIHWKQTRGPIEDRPGHWDLWNYRTTDGLGMLEFCQLAEDLDAEIMYVANCGMSCQFRNPEYADDAGTDWWLQNALDAIEYISGDASTPFGALRASDGHPAPFRLTYVEIGNENMGVEYRSRYLKFYHAIKAKYPHLTLIANERVEDAPLDMVDDHYYTAPQQFPFLHERYRDDGVPVYVGEYACNTDVGSGNLLGAISDAAFMVQMEKYSDRVRIASYAPLLCNDHDRTWPVNLINFDGSHVYGIPSFEVQRLFRTYAVSKVYQTDCDTGLGQPSSVHVTAGEREGRCVIKAVNFGPEATPVTVFAADCALTPRQTWLLASDRETDCNSLLYPRHVAAIAIDIQARNGKLELELPPWSLVIIDAECS